MNLYIYIFPTNRRYKEREREREREREKTTYQDRCLLLKTETLICHKFENSLLLGVWIFQDK